MPSNDEKKSLCKKIFFLFRVMLFLVVSFSIIFPLVPWPCSLPVDHKYYAVHTDRLLSRLQRKEKNLHMCIHTEKKVLTKSVARKNACTTSFCFCCFLKDEKKKVCVQTKKRRYYLQYNIIICITYIYIFTTVHKVMRGRKSDSLNEIKRVARFFSTNRTTVKSRSRQTNEPYQVCSMYV